MDEAQRNRKTAYLVGLCFVAVAVALSLITAPAAAEVAKRTPPTTLTAIFLIYSLGSIAVWYSVFLRPQQVVAMADRQSPRPSLARMAWLLSLMGVAGMIGPVVLGVILYQISGEIWRLLLLGGVGLVGGLILYGRVGRDLRVLFDHGLTGWDQFGPAA
jgi:hypothetical protein